MKNWSYKNFLIHDFEELASTNSLALQMIESGQVFDRQIILAKSQNLGRGRLDRAWSSPKGNLYFTLILQPQVLIEKASQISFVAIVALRQAVEQLAQNQQNLAKTTKFEEKSIINSKKAEKSQINSEKLQNFEQKNIKNCDDANIFEQKTAINIQNKWPNDLLINEKKVAGLLLESKNDQKNCQFAIIGIGVNLDSNPSNTMFPSANLQQFGIKTTPEILLKIFLDKFEILYKNWQDFGFANIRNAWISKAYNLKKEITAQDGDKKIQGIFEDMNQEGSLILLHQGQKKQITTADIF